MTTTKHRNLASVSVSGLFGHFDHSIPLNTDGLTLIHGPNGVGKTTVLRMIQLALDYDVRELAGIVFGRLNLSFDDDSELFVTRVERDAEPVPRSGLQRFSRDDDHTEQLRKIIKIEFTVCESDDSQQTFDVVLKSILEPPRRQVNEPDASRHRRFEHQWRRMGEEEKRLIGDLSFEFVDEDDEHGFDEFTERIGPSVPAHSIVSQRLVRTEPYVDSLTVGQPRHIWEEVEVCAVKMQKEFLSAVRLSAVISTGLDQSFAQRVLTPTDKLPPVDDEQLRKSYDELVHTWTEITSTGVLDEVTNPPRRRMYAGSQSSLAVDLQLPENLDETQLRVLQVYVNDTELKLEPFSRLLEKVELFRGLINSRFTSTGKVLRCDVTGFTVEVTEEGVSVPLAALSSGEQHQLVLNYALVFGIDQGSLILIDEPEISLHVSWQRQFIEQLHQIGELNGHRFIVATHSPQIIGEHWDHTVDLSPLGDETEKENG